MDTTLPDTLLDPAIRPAVVADLDRAVEARARAASGLSGAAVRAGHAAAQRIRPGFVGQAIDRLLPDFARALQPWWERYPGTGGFGAFLAADGPQVADALLRVTDRFADASHRDALRRAYRGLRPRALGLVEKALPAVGDVLEDHAA